jgi:hypothetical protein
MFAFAVNKDARRNNRGPRQARSWLGGVAIGALQSVMVSEAPLLRRVEPSRSRSVPLFFVSFVLNKLRAAITGVPDKPAVGLVGWQSARINLSS